VYKKKKNSKKAGRFGRKKPKRNDKKVETFNHFFLYYIIVHYLPFWGSATKQFCF